MIQSDKKDIKEFLLKLKKLQSEGDSIYPKGIFPSKRYHPFLPYQREDDNLFFTASVLHILQELRDELDEAELQVLDDIQANAISSYSQFQNKDGLDTYNFWQTNPSRHFPNGWFMHRFKHFQIPDDVDDTALVYLTEGRGKENIKWLREKLKNHSNLAYKKAFNPLPKYRELKCYSTFFGKKMYIEFDVCVLSNLMRVILTHFKTNELNNYDLDTLKFIESVIVSREFESHPFYSAPNYPNTELIIYHLSRLVPHLPDGNRKLIEPIIAQSILEKISLAKGLNRVLLENSALKLKLKFKPTDFDESIIEDRDFFFFHAGMITAFENRLAQKLASNRFFHLRYTSKALNRALLIENYVLRRALTR